MNKKIHKNLKKEFKDSTLSILINLLESAMQKKPKIEIMANKLFPKSLEIKISESSSKVKDEEKEKEGKNKLQNLMAERYCKSVFSTIYSDYLSGFYNIFIHRFLNKITKIALERKR